MYNKKNILILTGFGFFIIKSVIEILILKGKIEISPTIKVLFFEIHLYSLSMILAAFVLVFLINRLKLKDKYLKSVDVETVLMFAVIPGIIGARVWHLATDWQFYQNDPLSALYLWNGGLGIYGAVIGVALGIHLYSRIYKKDFLRILNVAALFLPLAQIIGRYGNLFNQELFGSPTTLPWGIFIRKENRPDEFIENSFFHPAYLYEQIGNFVLLIINYLLYKRFKLKPTVFLATWLMGYGVIRFIVEFFRLDDKYYVQLSANQIASIPIIILGIIIMIFSFRNNVQKKK